MQRILRNSWLALVTLLAACSAPPSSDAGGDTDAFTPSSVEPFSKVDDGLYTATNADLHMGLWNGEDEVQGRLVYQGTDAYTLVINENEQVMSAIDGACPGCASTDWLVAMAQGRDGEIDLHIIDPAGPSRDTDPGFADVLMVPHDGFKPERSPAPDVDVWAGAVIAVEPSFDDAPALDTDCELTVQKSDQQITSLGCLSVGADSPWVSVRADSWSEDGGRVSLVVESDAARLGWLGETSGPDNNRRFEGTIHALEDGEQPSDQAPVIGRFALSLLGG